MADKKSENENLDPERVRSWFDTFCGDQCICQYCGFDGRRTPEDWVQLQGDHLIPRDTAGEYADDPLNRVTACYYCNTIKKDFNPAEEIKMTKVPDRETQQQLIQIASEEIRKRKDNIWRYGGGLESSFDFMMRRLRK